MSDHPVIVDVISGPGVEPHLLLVIGDKIAREPLNRTLTVKLLKKLAEVLCDVSEADNRI
jgi:hypothetical protein